MVNKIINAVTLEKREKFVRNILLNFSIRQTRLLAIYNCMNTFQRFRLIQV